MNRPTETARPLVLFDGVCSLCAAWVRWILARDTRGEFRFASLQSDAARAALAAAGARTDHPESVVLIDGDGVHMRSDAIIRIARRLGLPGAPIAAGAVVPRPLRDAVYAWVARNRYGWFGRRSECMVPAPELRSRFLDADESRGTADTELPGAGAPAGSG
jgi:predicted DCC family thiol-disulfide oxidoreductase YuxK